MGAVVVRRAPWVVSVGFATSSALDLANAQVGVDGGRSTSGQPQQYAHGISNLSIDLDLLEPSTCSFHLPAFIPNPRYESDPTLPAIIDNPAYKYIVKGATDCWIYRDGQPMFRGRLIDVNEDPSPGGGVDLSFVDYRGLLDEVSSISTDQAFVATAMPVGDFIWKLIGLAEQTSPLGLTKGSFPVTLVTVDQKLNSDQSVWEPIHQQLITDTGPDLDIDFDLKVNIYPHGKGTITGVTLDQEGLISEAKVTSSMKGYANSIKQLAGTYATGKNKGKQIPPFIYENQDGINKYGRWFDTSANPTPSLTSEQMRDAYGRELVRKTSTLEPSFDLKFALGAWGGLQHVGLGDGVDVRIARGLHKGLYQSRVFGIKIEVDANLNESVTVEVGKRRKDLAKDLRDLAERYKQDLLSRNQDVIAQPTSGLKTKVVGGYLAKYDNSMPLNSVDKGYNLIFLFQAGAVAADAATYPQGTGAVEFYNPGVPEAYDVGAFNPNPYGGDSYGLAVWKAQIKTWREDEGRSVVMTLGGAGAYIDISTDDKVNTLLTSIQKMYDDLGGFDGIDFNLETSFAYVSGTATTGTSSTQIYDSTKTWAPNQFANDPAFKYEVVIASGTGMGQKRTISASGPTSLTVSAAFSPAPDTTSVYEIGIPVFPDKMVAVAQECRRIYGPNFTISVPAAGTFFGNFIQHDFDLVQALYNGKDQQGKKLLDFLAPQYYDLWFGINTTTDAARAAYVVGQAPLWAAKVNNDWAMIGMGFLTNLPVGVGSIANSGMSTDASRIAYLLTNVENPALRGAFHFSIQFDYLQAFKWVKELAPIIAATTTGEGAQVPVPGSSTTFDSATGWTVTGGASITGGNLVLPFGDYGLIRQGTRTSPLSLNDGYIQMELTSRVGASPDGAILDFGYTSGADYVYLRMFKGGSITGFELHSKLGSAAERVSFLPFPYVDGQRYYRIRKVFNYLFVSVATSNGQFKNMTFEDLSVLPSYTSATPFIRSNGLAADGNWTIASFNVGP